MDTSSPETGAVSPTVGAAPNAEPVERQRRRVSPRYAKMRKAAEAGDFAGIIAEIDPDCLVGSMDREQAQKEFRTAIDALSNDPARLIDGLFGQVLRFQAVLLLRAQSHVEMLIQQTDQHSSYRGDLPAVVTDTWLPRISKIQAEIRATARDMAAIRHTMSLADKGPLEARKRSDRVVRIDEGRPAIEREATG